MQRPCSLQRHWSQFGKLNKINILLNRECLLKSIAETKTTKVQFGVRTAIIFQLFGVHGKCSFQVTCNDAKLFRVVTNLISLQFLMYDLIVLNTVFEVELISFTTIIFAGVYVCISNAEQ
jgi:hypothetical protein